MGCVTLTPRVTLDGVETPLIVVFVLAMLIDLILNETEGKLSLIHPVVLCGKLSEKMIKPYASKSRGVLLWFSSVFPILLPINFLIYLSLTSGFPLSLLIAALILKSTFSARMLDDIVRRVKESIEEGKLSKARREVGRIVRRDVKSLDEEHIISAAIESLAESCVDGVVSPLFYFPFLGVTGAMLQRLANTMDSMVGYKTPEFKDQGWFSAMVDTILNYVPARLTAVLMIVSAILLRKDFMAGISAVRRYRRETESVNAGWPMSAMAGILGVKLEKIGCYSIGEPKREMRGEVIGEALSIYRVTVALALALILGLLFLPGLPILP